MSFVSADLPGGARRVSYDVPGGPLAAVDLLPEGEPHGTALLVPGFSGSKEDFGPLLPELAAGGWRVVALDQRGQYESPGPDDASAYTVEALAADVLAVAEEIGTPLHLLGHSFGGLVTRAAVLRRPAAFRSLVLLGSGPEALTGPRVDVLPFLPGVIEGGGMAAVADASEAMSPNDNLGQPVPEPVKAFLRERWIASSAVGLIAMGDALCTEPDRVDALRATGVPVLVAHGELDDAWLPQVQAGMAERLGATYEVVPGAAHSPNAEQPEATAKALLAFWGQLS